MADAFITVTFSERAENHAGMQVIGQEVQQGLTRAELEQLAKAFAGKQASARIYDLREELGLELDDAFVLVIQQALEEPLVQDLYGSLAKLPWDEKAWMRGRVVQKRARYNLCFADVEQEPDYANRKGRVVHSVSTRCPLPTAVFLRQEPDYANRKGRVVQMSRLPALERLQATLAAALPERPLLCAEGNYYYDASCGIGLHGDAERKVVVGFRFGASAPLEFQGFRRGQPEGRRLSLQLQQGDVYAGTAKAFGHDWKKSAAVTVRHAAGARKYLRPEAVGVGEPMVIAKRLRCVRAGGQEESLDEEELDGVAGPQLEALPLEVSQGAK